LTAFAGYGCRYLLNDREQCGKARRRGSSYCPEHHAACYIPRGSEAEARHLRQIALVANYDAFFSRAPPTEPTGHG
jgi:hypothetical protein